MFLGKFCLFLKVFLKFVMNEIENEKKMWVISVVHLN